MPFPTIYQRIGCLAVFSVVCVAFSASTAVADRLGSQLAAGEFAAALASTKAMPNDAMRDKVLTRIAAVQDAAGMRSGALKTLRQVSSESDRNSALAGMFGKTDGSALTGSFGTGRGQVGRGGPGGGSQADFDALIELITSTVNVESWEEAGGPGSIREFAGGVYVDPAGVVRRIEVVDSGGLVGLRRMTQRKILGQKTPTPNPSPEDGGGGLGLASGNPEDEGGDLGFANADARRPSKLRYVSLPRLEREILFRRAAGEPWDEAMHVLAGLQRVQFVFAYPETGDLVIAGPAGPWYTNDNGLTVAVDTGQPVVRLEDFVTLWRRLREHGPGEFGCSIVPKQQNLAAAQAFLAEVSKKPLKPNGRDAWLDGIRDRVGRQTIRVFGLDPRTRAARVLVEADYRMKLVGMGLEDGVPGVISYLDSIKVRPGQPPPPMDVLRWWFTLNYHSIATTRERDAFEIRGSGVKVLSENELLTAKGERVHTGRSDALNQQFASSFTNHFDSLCQKYSIYADLRNIFDLALVVALVDSEGLADRIEWTGDAFLTDELVPIELAAAPREVETVINHRVIGRRHVVAGVSGGVSINVRPFVANKKIETDAYGAAFDSRIKVPEDLGRTAWWWDRD